MQDQTKQIPSDSDSQIERVIVSQILRDDHDKRWARAELEAELDHTDPLAVGEALTRLSDQDVIELSGETVQASRATVHLDELEMIAV
jgi:hypothetical protein